MRKIILTTVFNLVFLSLLYSQAYNPLIRENTYWDENHGNGSAICFLSGGDRFFFQGDTMINSISYGDTAFSNTQYKILRAYPLYAINPGPYCPPFGVDYNATSIKALMREDTTLKQVYLYNDADFSERLLFDFSLNVGDTLISLGSSYPIDSIGLITLFNGETRKIWYVESPNNAYYIEGIGGSQGVYHNFDVGLGFWEIPMCITENNLSIWGNECSTIVGIDEVEITQTIKVYPNPVKNMLVIEKEDYTEEQFLLTDLCGKLVLEKIIISKNETINMIKITKGIYLYSLGEKTKGKIIKF